MNRKALIGAAAVVVLAVAGTVLWGVKKTRDLESSAAASAAQATSYLREAAAFALGDPQAVETLRLHGEDLDARLAALRAEDASRNRALAEAAEIYVSDVRAILRNHAGASRALIAARASRLGLAAHLDRAAARGPGWIDTAVKLKKRAEQDSFEARTAAEALEGLLKGHRDSQARLRAVLPGAPLLEEGARAKLQQAARAALDKAEQDLQQLRRLPIA
ncbi:MAG: hypothetical protein OEW94_10865 [Betaproteobacteria bacterium]|nr:hypothetical protein [Betaproteobacteria bacterium]MDH5351063.1 hypothetical protein [Betaproteobacteria bacterium]